MSTTEKKIALKYPILSSSQNSENISLTVKGLLVGLIPLAMFIARQYKVELNYNEVYAIAETLALLISASVALIGLLRKVHKR